MTNTFDRLKTILIKDYKLAPEVLTPDASLDGLGIDSLGVAELLFNVEDEFHVTLPPDPVSLATVGDVVLFIDGLIDARAHQDALREAAVTVTAALPG